MCISSQASDCRAILQNLQDKTPKASPKKRSIMEQSPGLPQDTKSLPKLCEAALERRCFSKVIVESNVTPKITRSSDSFSTVLPIDYGSYWGYIVRDLEVLVLLASNFISQRSYHSLTLPRLRIRDSATATLMLGDGITAIKVESSA